MKVLVIGENVTDVFVYGSVTRLAPDGPFPIFQKEHAIENNGCAGNVCSNLRSLNPLVSIEFLHNSEKITKTRYVEKNSNYTLIRIDENDHVETLCEHEVFWFLRDGVTYDAVVISDYKKGLLNPSLMSKIFRSCKQKNIPTFLDTKHILGEWSRECFAVKINNKEYNDNIQAGTDPEKYCENLIVTLGGKGARYQNVIYPVGPVEVIDLSGCGDSFLSGLVINYLRTKDLSSAIHYANKVARIAASKKGVVSICADEV